ncbi:FAD-dependent oxidoreductase [Bordetella parapertussis]|uniref:FAD-dependent oxidoreductase n=1 Tax=Bordetella parapertussis TaxID=519 RepID=UPI0039E11B11
MAMDSIAIIGAGQAGAALAARLRQAGFQGGIDVFGAESAPPYQRPPLSKKYLAGDWEQERLWLRPAQFWREQGIALHLGGTVEALDLASRTLRCGGRRHGWRKLALTTGAAPFAGGVRGPQQCVRAAQSGRRAALAAGVPGRAQVAGAGGRLYRAGNGRGRRAGGVVGAGGGARVPGPGAGGVPGHGRGHPRPAPAPRGAHP